jgi:aminoglycoside phosphotransferase (APT) family kinase protein
MTSKARPRTLEPGNLAPLEAWLAETLAATRVEVRAATLLSGGAVQENWRIDVGVDGGPRAGSHAWVLRTDAAAVISMSLDRASEYAVLAAAHAAAIPVAEPVARCADPGIVGAPFLVQAFVPGNAQARRIVRDPELATWGRGLAAELGTALAAIHCITLGGANIPSLPVPLSNPARNEVAKCVAAIAGAGEPRPALAYVLRWLDIHAPESFGDVVLVHGDYRTGNYLVEQGRLAAILDWEFAHWGDPDEDIGWFCARCWRFGNDAHEAGGIAPRADFIAAYEAAAGRKVDPLRIRYWEILAAARWASVALLQGDRFRKGGETSVELALTGLMVAELELEAFDGIRAYEAAAGD